MAYNDAIEGDDITPQWGNMVEDALGGKSTVTTTNVYPAQGATYVVFKSGSYYCARNGLTGKIDFDDTTFPTLMNETILAMFDNGNGTGGRIDIKSKTGVYEVPSPINMRAGINVYGPVITGDVGGTELSTTLQATADTEIFIFNYPSGANKHYFGGIHNLNLEGYGTTGVATKANIDMLTDSNHCSDTRFTHLYSHDGRYGMRLYNNHASNKIWNIFIDRCMNEANDYQGLLIDSPTNQIIERVIVTHGHYYNNCQSSGNGGIEIGGHSTYAGILHHNTLDTEQKHSIYLADEADHWTLDGNVIKDGGAAGANTYDGISLNDVDYIAVTGGNIGNITTANLKYAINSDNNCTYCGFTGVTVNSATDPAIIQGTGAGMKTSNCPGYLNYNSGVTAAIASGTDIPHGLISGATGLTPTCVLAQVGTTGATGPWTDTLGATNFKHNWVGGGNETVYWIAIYDP